jgi:hypothetical protein
VELPGLLYLKMKLLLLIMAPTPLKLQRITALESKLTMLTTAIGFSGTSVVLSVSKLQYFVNFGCLLLRNELFIFITLSWNKET